MGFSVAIYNKKIRQDFLLNQDIRERYIPKNQHPGFRSYPH